MLRLIRKNMAELSDYLNRTVLHVDFEKQDAERLFSNVKLVFQHRVFIDNSIGWINEIQSEVKWYKLQIDPAALVSFINAAKSWSELSLSKLSKTFFSGTWNLGTAGDRFDIEFNPLAHALTKTDAFTVSLYIGSRKLWKKYDFPSDYTCLVDFIKDLSESIA